MKRNINAAAAVCFALVLVALCAFPASAEKSKELKPADVLKRSIGEYSKIKSYEVKFYLLQPRTKKDLENADTLEKLTEKYRLVYSRGKSPMDSWIRLEGLYGTNYKTTAIFTPDKTRITVYRPGKKLSMSPDDKRMQDFFTMDLLGIVTDANNVLADSGVKVTMVQGGFKKTEDAKNPVDCYVITIETKENRSTLYINTKTFLLERQELETPIGKRGSDKLMLTRRQTWFAFKPISGDAKGTIAEKPKFSKR